MSFFTCQITRLLESNLLDNLQADIQRETKRGRNFVEVDESDQPTGRVYYFPNRAAAKSRLPQGKLYKAYRVDLERVPEQFRESVDQDIRRVSVWLDKKLAGCSPHEISQYLQDNETAIADRLYTGGCGGNYLTCEDARDILETIFQRRGIPYEVILRDPGSDVDWHVWLRYRGADLDPTQQGTHDGKVVRRWPPAKK